VAHAKRWPSELWPELQRVVFLPAKCKECPHNKSAGMPDMPEGMKDFFMGLHGTDVGQPGKKR
jgi:hypothetical protein